MDINPDRNSNSEQEYNTFIGFEAGHANMRVNLIHV